MDRKEFIVKSILGSLAFGSAIAYSEQEASKKVLNNAGFDHLSNIKSNIMTNTVLHLAETRGKANHGWLNSFHTFSFSSYFNKERMNFGALRVLNDDTVSAGMGFGTHPHQNMEIISIPLVGEMEHKDSMNNIQTIKSGDVQVMSAGTGITHSEYNKNKDAILKFLQIWVIPNKMNVTPRYDQMTLNVTDRTNKFQQILSPNEEDEGVWIHQNAWFHLGLFDSNKTISYQLKDKENNGVYAFIISGKATVHGVELNERDGFGIWNSEEIQITSNSDNTEILLMEVPMIEI